MVHRGTRDRQGKGRVEEKLERRGGRERGRNEGTSIGSFRRPGRTSNIF